MRTMLSLIGVVGVLAGVPASASAFTAFQSPSKNIGCYIDTGSGIRCDIAHKQWTPPPRPANCDGDYGQGLFVFGSGKGRVVCAGDTALGNGPVLAYGRTKRLGKYSCKSTSAGMKCANNKTHHGFFLSIQRYQLF